jgi:tRNA A-37 threonylcarbamoyl transferase component Bud32
VARAVAVVGALIIIAGGAAIGYAVTREAAGGMSPMQSDAMAKAVAQLDSSINELRASLKTRARSLSAPGRVHAAIATDTGTVENLIATGDLIPESGELLELGRIDKTNKDAPKVEVLFPRGATQASHGGARGSYVEIDGDQLVVTEITSVDPTERADQFDGFLAVTRRLDLAPRFKALLDAGITGRLVIGGKETAIGAMPEGTPTGEHALTAAQGAKIIVAEPPPHAIMPLPILGGGIGAAALGLVLLAVGMRRRAAPPVLEPPLSRATPPPSHIAMAETQLSQGAVAAGTPLPVDPASGPLFGGPSNLGPGAMIGRWEVVRRLGSGGMADVYLAQSKGEAGFEKLVAIKVMHSHLARNQRAVEHFLDEARLAARIHHPNVVPILDLGKIGEDYVIVMEYVEGVDLERLLTSARQGGRPVPIAVGLGILCRICDGLDGAHHAMSPDGTELGIVHRDVKSANVLVSRLGIVKLVDFGIAKAATQAHLTVAGETKGTPSMMSPEQRVGEEVDVRADVYSAAAVGYELMTGCEVNLDLAALAHLGIDNWPHLPPPSSQRAGLPPELDGLLLSAMAWERERRPADCAAFGALCEAIMRHHNLVTSDKDIARWVDAELRYLAPALGGVPSSLSKSPPV